MKFETLNKLQEYIKYIYYIGLKHETLHFQIPFINLLCSSGEIKVIKSNVALERRLSFQKQKHVIHPEPKKSQSKPCAQNKFSVAKDEKLKTKEVRILKFIFCMTCLHFFSKKNKFSPVSQRDAHRIEHTITKINVNWICITCD